MPYFFNRFTAPDPLANSYNYGGQAPITNITPYNTSQYDDPTQDPTQDPAPQPPDFASQWAKIVANQPNRNRLQQLITQGAPVVPHTKMNRLASILSAVGIGYKNPALGVQAGDQVFNEPQDRSDALYQQQVKNLSGLAGLESDDMQRQLEGLKFNQDSIYKSADEKRADTELGLHTKEVNANIANQQADNARADLFTWTDNEGNLHEQNHTTHADRIIGRTKDTPEQETADAANKAAAVTGATEKAKAPYVAAEADREAKARLDEIKAQGDNQQALQNNKNAASMARVTARLQSMEKALKPGDQNKAVFNAVNTAISNDPSLANANYITTNPSTGGLMVTPDSMWDDEEDKKAKDKLRTIIGSAYLNNTNKAAGTGTGSGKSGGPGITPPPAGFTIRRGPG
jgi:hypothetical protein